MPCRHQNSPPLFIFGNHSLKPRCARVTPVPLTGSGRQIPKAHPLRERRRLYDRQSVKSLIEWPHTLGSGSGAIIRRTFRPEHSRRQRPTIFHKKCSNLALGEPQKIGNVLTWHSKPKPRRKP